MPWLPGFRFRGKIGRESVLGLECGNGVTVFAAVTPAGVLYRSSTGRSWRVAHHAQNSFYRHLHGISPIPLPTFSNTPAAKSRSSRECVAEFISRMRSLPFGTVGKLMAIPKIPFSNKA